MILINFCGNTTSENLDKFVDTPHYKCITFHNFNLGFMNFYLCPSKARIRTLREQITIHGYFKVEGP